MRRYAGEKGQAVPNPALFRHCCYCFLIAPPMSNPESPCRVKAELPDTMYMTMLFEIEFTVAVTRPFEPTEYL
jgi:hypothetical protein